MKKHITQRIKTTFWVLLVTGVAALSLTAARLQADGVIERVEAEIVVPDETNTLILPDEIIGMVTKKFGPLKNLTPDMVDMRSIETYLTTHPYVRKAHVFVGASGSLVLQLHQRVPVMRLVDNGGRHWYIDKDTVMMPVSKQFVARVPLVNGDFPSTTHARNWPMTNLFAITDEMHEDEFLNYLVDQIYVEKKDKIWLIPRLGPSRILIGDGKDLADKSYRIRKFYKEALPAAGWNAYSYIDTRFAGQIVARKKLNL